MSFCVSQKQSVFARGHVAESFRLAAMARFATDVRAGSGTGMLFLIMSRFTPSLFEHLRAEDSPRGSEQAGEHYDHQHQKRVPEIFVGAEPRVFDEQDERTETRPRLSRTKPMSCP